MDNQNSTANPPIVPPAVSTGDTSDPGTAFGNAVMQMMQKYQNINKTPFLPGQLNAQSQAAAGVAYNDPNLIGASPSQQAQSQNANTQGPAQAAQNYQQAGQTFSSQLQSFESALNQIGTIGPEIMNLSPGPAVLAGYGQAISQGAALSIIPEAVKPAVMSYLSKNPQILQSWQDHQKIAVQTVHDPNTGMTYSIMRDPSNGQMIMVSPPTQGTPTTPTTPSSSSNITSPSGASYNLQGYATDPTKVAQVQSILDTMGKLSTPQDITSYLAKFKGTPITADMITSASQKYGVGWEEILAQMQQESQMGTQGAATGVLGKNNFGAVGNTGTHTNSYDTPQGGVDATAKALADRKNQSQISSQGAKPTLEQAQAKAKGTPLPSSIMEKAAYDLAFGNTPPPSSTIPRSAATAQYQNQITQRAEQLNPNFKLSAAAGQYKYATDVATKTKVQAINAVLPNMDTLISLSDAFSRSDYPTINSVLRSLGWLTGNQTVSSLNEAASIVGDEMGVALGGGTMSDMKLQLGIKITDPILSAKNYATNINMVKAFLNNRLQSIAQQAGPYAQDQLGITPQNTALESTVASKGYNYQAMKGAGYSDDDIKKALGIQ